MITIILEKEYSQYWKTIVHTIRDGLMVVDSDGTILSVNEAIELLTGYSKNELIGQSCMILNCNKCLMTRKKGGNLHCELFKYGHVRHSKCVMQKKDGSPLHVIKRWE